MQPIHPDFGIEIPVYILSILIGIIHGLLALGAIIHIIKSWGQFKVSPSIVGLKANSITASPRLISEKPPLTPSPDPFHEGHRGDDGLDLLGLVH